MEKLCVYYPHAYVESIFTIDYPLLYQMGYRGLIFDIDNTLVSHGTDSTPSVDELFSQLHAIGFKTLLLSNNSEERILRFIKHIDTTYISDARKPDTQYFQKAVSMLDIKDEQAIVIGDDVFKDVRGANNSLLTNILVRYIGYEKKEWKGFHRNMERIILFFYHHNKKYYQRLGNIQTKKTDTMQKKKKLFCEISPTTYAISLQKEILKRHIKNLLSHERLATKREKERLSVIVSSYSNNMIKRGPGIDMRLQQNKEENIKIACSKIDGLVILPGETFSFWKLVGKTSKRNGFAEGRVLVNGKLIAGVGGGLCNLANTINLLVLESPLTITELHHHSDALAPDPNGKHEPYSAGTSVNYNFIDYRFRNDTTQPVQLCTWCEGDDLHAELLTTIAYPHTYRITEENHHFHQEEDGKYYRISNIYRETLDRATGKVIKRELHWKNHSEVMFDYAQIPKEQIR